jgi:serine/threonine protein kinase
MILGTAADRTAQQAKGKTADKRADIWAFGCVLYEMLSGRRPFTGETVSETLADVMKSEPPWGALPADHAADELAARREEVVSRRAQILPGRAVPI